MITSYFLGGVSSTGFRSKFFDQLDKPDYYTYILKGGPGTGKSTLMKKIAKRYGDDCDVDVYYCSSDTSSLDAVVIHDKKIIIADGTAPHVMEAKYPGVSQEIVNLGTFWNKQYLKSNAYEIRAVAGRNSALHAKARRIVTAISAVNDDIKNTAFNALLTEKLSGYIKRLAKREIPKKSSVETGSIEYKQVSALTADGYLTQPLKDTGKTYLLKDDFFAGSDVFLRRVAEIAMNAGYNTEVSECYLFGENIFEYLFIPELDLKFISSNFINRVSTEDAKIISFGRFYDSEKLALRKNRLGFDKKVCGELTAEASLAIANALTVHDELEKYYIEALDFESLDAFTKKFIEEL